MWVAVGKGWVGEGIGWNEVGSVTDVYEKTNNHISYSVSCDKLDWVGRKGYYGVGSCAGWAS